MIPTPLPAPNTRLITYMPREWFEEILPELKLEKREGHWNIYKWRNYTVRNYLEFYHIYDENNAYICSIDTSYKIHKDKVLVYELVDEYEEKLMNKVTKYAEEIIISTAKIISLITPENPKQAIKHLGNEIEKVKQTLNKLEEEWKALKHLWSR